MPNNSDIKGLIKAHAASATGNTKKAIENLWVDLEKSLEDMGRTQQFHGALTSHLTERTEEIKSIRTTRKYLLYVAVIMCVFVLATFYYVLLCPKSDVRLDKLPDASKVAFISASFITSFGLIGVILKGLLKSNNSDEGTGVIPESIKTIIELFKDHAAR